MKVNLLWWISAAMTAVLLFVGAGVYLWWSQREPPPPELPLPTGIEDAEVKAVLEKGHGRVLRHLDSADAWGEYGTILLAHLFDREADRCFAEAAKLDPKDPRWPYARGVIALKRDPPNAVAYLTTAAEAARNQPLYETPFTLALAEALLEHGETDRADKLFQQVLAASAQDERAQFGLGLVALARGDDATAEKQFMAVQDYPSCRKQAKAHLAILARARNDTSAAKQYESESNALEADPPWPDPYLDRVVRLQVGFRGFQRRVGVLERDRQFLEAAEAYLAQAQSRRTSQMLTGAGVNFARVHDYDRALGLLREAVQLDPNDSKAHYTLALVLFTKAEKEAARNPSNPDLPRWFREVIAETKITIELKPDHAQAYLFWGLALKYLGEPKAAIEPLRKGLVIRPADFELLFGLGEVLAATGDTAGAEANLKAARQLKPDDPRPPAALAKLKANP